ncbi:TetR/AcrR family transcriptional regulator [Kitasatospora sp. NPDC059646]|uniref:TetR/AcrR family transcriptional regulator n=1 Tax=Kitasatospora sp. NPDC059646 TaxID=3346893 RepID=UPI003679F7B1
MTTTPSPRSDTRARIIDVALELFAEHGYEKTSLREIADRLGVTKAALYYHFKTKDDIVRGIVEKMAAPLDDAIAFGEGKEWSPELRDELLRRFAAGMGERAPLLRFFHENQPALRESAAGLAFKDRMIKMITLLHGPEPTFRDKLRATVALTSMHSAMFLLKADLCEGSGGQPAAAAPSLDEAMEAALEVALEVAARIEPSAH